MSGSEQQPPARGAGRHGLAELIAERRAKAQRLKDSDGDAFPYVFRDAEPIAEIQRDYAHLKAGEETEEVHRTHFHVRDRTTGGIRAMDRYLSQLEQIRRQSQRSGCVGIER